MGGKSIFHKLYVQWTLVKGVVWGIRVKKQRKWAHQALLYSSAERKGKERERRAKLGKEEGRRGGKEEKEKKERALGMGAEALPKEIGFGGMVVVAEEKHDEEEAPPLSPPLIVGLQPSALVDHVARVDCSLLKQIPGDFGGSLPVTLLLSLRHARAH